jgi:hypothetical protein
MATEIGFDGYGCLPANVALTAALYAYGVDVPLSATPGIITTVQLDMSVRSVRLYSADQAVRFALDGHPEPPMVATGTTVPWATFLLGTGDTLSANAWHWVWVPNTYEPHALNLLSPGGGLVQVIAYVERVY